MPALDGARVALLEARMRDEMSALVRRFGGVPQTAPAVREVPRPENIPRLIDALIARRFSAVVFLTGVGVTSLLREAERLGRLEGTLAALRATTVACRGPKPSSALKRYDVAVHVTADEPYTTSELVDSLTRIHLDGERVALVHYGEPNRGFSDALKRRGALLEEFVLYEWLLPEDVTPLVALIDDLIAKRIDAIAFTSQIQFRHLMQVAARLGKADELKGILNDHTIVAAIGPVCAAALGEHGVRPDVLPTHPKMGPLVRALADYIELCADSSAH
jgi:uroporphyrinogen-III synthase